MTLQTDIKQLLGPLVDNRVYEDRAPQELNFSRPYIVFFEAGGAPSNTLCGNTDRQNVILQFNVWADRSDLARQLMIDAAKLLTDPPLRGVSQGGAVSRPGPETRSFGRQQDFSFWYRP